jgi:hypothetical protein
MEWFNSLSDDMCRFIGQTVTIFTTSGGLSGSGFTGVLLSIDCNAVRLLVEVGEYPACPIGSDCDNIGDNCNLNNCDNGNHRNHRGNPLGAVCIIPTCAIACFTHNAI